MVNAIGAPGGTVAGGGEGAGLALTAYLPVTGGETLFTEVIRGEILPAVRANAAVRAN
jgi:hypothetical protein